MIRARYGLARQPAIINGRGAALFVAILLLLPAAAAAQANGHLQIHYLNIGQGDAALIVSPLGQTMLIDSGPFSASSCASPTGIVTQLTALGVTTLDYHVASHYDADHIGCSDHVAARFPVQQAAYDRGTAGPPATATYTRYATAMASTRQTVSVGQQIVLDPGSAAPVTFQVIAVNGNGTAGSLDENDRSVVLVLHFGSFDAEFGGDLAGQTISGRHDIESPIATVVGQVEVYKVHHHGSATSSNAAWMTTIHPKVAVLSVGSPNAFDHPTQVALDRIRASGAITYWTTAGDGAPAISAFDVVANGRITVDVPPAGTTFTVLHGGVFESYGSWGTAGCTYAIAPASASVPGAGGSGSVTVTTSSGCSWSAASNDGAISVSSGSSGSGSGTVGYAVSANPFTAARTGTITIAGQLFTITQSGASPVCSYTISPLVALYPLTGGDGAVSVATSSGCSWTAVSDSAFATITSGASGSGPGTVTYAVAPATVARSATLLIAGRSFAITQRIPSAVGAEQHDVDGDEKSDLTVFRPSNGTWYVRYSAQGYSTAGANAFQWGLPGDMPLSADFDGDGKTELTVFRPSTGTWYIRYSSLGYSTLNYDAFQWGLAGDVPLVGDFDGDGRTDLTVFRPSSGTWFIRLSSQGFSIATAAAFQWGLLGDVPLIGDFDGDDRSDLTIYRPSSGTWFIRLSSQAFSIATAATFQWGLPGDVPLIGDFDGDGRADLTVFRPSSGTWFMRLSSQFFDTATAATFQWGLMGDIPMAGDFDGDARTDLTVWRPSNGTWYVRYSSLGYTTALSDAFQWGLPGDAIVK